MKKDEELSLGYETTIQLIIYEGSLVWTRFNTILTTHLILFGIIGLLLTSDSEVVRNKGFIFILSVFGIFLSFFWFVMTSRGFVYLRYLTLSAREYEDKIKSKNLITLKRGYIFSKDFKVVFDLPDDLSSYQRPWYAKLFNSMNTELSAYLTITTIGLVYIVICVWSVIFSGNSQTNFYNMQKYKHKSIIYQNR